MTSTRSRAARTILVITAALLLSKTSSAQDDEEEKKKPKPEWWIKGALAALEDPDPEVVSTTLEKMVENNAANRVPRAKLPVIERYLNSKESNERVLGGTGAGHCDFKPGRA